MVCGVGDIQITFNGMRGFFFLFSLFSFLFYLLSLHNMLSNVSQFHQILT